MKTDLQLKHDVQAELEWDPEINHSAIGVDVLGGIVTLAGQVQSFSEKWAAEQAVARVADVRGLAVEIDVHLPQASARSDADIARAALQALSWDVSIAGDNIRVMVEKGWLTLTGVVQWEYRRKAAEQVVRRLIGVVGVTNLIELKHAPGVRDVKQKIEAALQRSAHLDTKAINVAVEEGHVTLSGRVHSLTDRERVARAAWAAPGVRTVVDHLTVSGT